MSAERRVRRQPEAVTPTVINASMSDLVAVAFYHVGYRPRQSMVLVGLHGPRTQVGMVVRGDLPPPAHQRRSIASQVEVLRRHGDDQLVGLVISDAVTPESDGGLRLPRRALVRELRYQAARQGMHLLDVLAVGPSRWRSYSCADPGCCPREGRLLEEALSGPAAAELVALGHVLVDDEADLVADIEPVATSPGTTPPAPEVGRAGSGPAAAAPAGSSPSDRGHAVEGARLDPSDAEQALRRWRDLLADPGRATTDDLAWLTDVLEDHWIRDSVLLTLVPGSGTVPEEVLAGVDSAAVDTVFKAGPDPELLERGRTLLAAVARSAPPGHRADALALLAWAAWWSGHGTRGRLLAQRALADVPGHRLAALVDRLLLLAVAPDWVRGDSSGRVGPAAGSERRQ